MFPDYVTTMQIRSISLTWLCYIMFTDFAITFSHIFEFVEAVKMNLPRGYCALQTSAHATSFCEMYQNAQISRFSYIK